jgi:hypothetical protein
MDIIQDGSSEEQIFKPTYTGGGFLSTIIYTALKASVLLLLIRQLRQSRILLAELTNAPVESFSATEIALFVLAGVIALLKIIKACLHPAGSIIVSETALTLRRCLFRPVVADYNEIAVNGEKLLLNDKCLLDLSDISNADELIKACAGRLDFPQKEDGKTGTRRIDWKDYQILLLMIVATLVIVGLSMLPSLFEKLMAYETFLWIFDGLLACRAVFQLFGLAKQAKERWIQA